MKEWLYNRAREYLESAIVVSGSRVPLFSIEVELQKLEQMLRAHVLCALDIGVVDRYQQHDKANHNEFVPCAVSCEA